MSHTKQSQKGNTFIVHKLMLIAFFIFSTLISSLQAQNQEQKVIDSLLTELKIVRADTSKVNLYNQMSERSCWYGNYNNARKYADSALTLSLKIKYNKGRASAFNNMGAVNFFQGDYPISLNNSLNALQIAEPMELKNEMAIAYNNVGRVNWRQNNYAKAIENYLKSIKIMEVLGHKSGMAKAYNNIGLVYAKQSEFKKAIENYTTAFELMKSIGDTRSQYIIYINIGDMHSKMGDYTQALKTYFVALHEFERIGDNKGLSISYLSIGKSYIELGRPAEGKKWLQKCLLTSINMEVKEYIKDSYSALANVDSILGNYSSALENYKMYVTYRDSLINEKNTRQLTQAAMQYEFDKKQLSDSLNNVQQRSLSAENLKKQKVYTGMGLSLAILLLAFSGFVFRNNKNLATEKQKSESLLLNILPSEVADELKEKGKAEAKQFDKVSVLLTDFVNFTQASEFLSPQVIVKELNECFTAFDNIIERNGLEKIKTIGDAYLAVCGLPTSDPKHAKKTVQAAIEIIEFIKTRKQKEQVFDIRIGINSGSVIAGIVGVKKFAYDIWGDTVNTAARMEQSSEAGKINISEATYQLVKDDYDCTHRGKLEAKGKGALEMYFVENKKPNM